MPEPNADAGASSPASVFDERTVRVGLVGDDPLARGGLAAILAGLEGVMVTGQASAADNLGPALHTAGVVVWDMGPGSPADLDRLRALPRTAPPVLALVARGGDVSGAWSAGARGVLLRDVAAVALAAAVKALARGLVVLDDQSARDLIRRPRPGSSMPAPESLTPRELEVLQLLSEGLSNKLIAARLGITEHTAKFHVNAILGKLGAQSRTEAIVHAARLGLVVI